MRFTKHSGVYTLRTEQWLPISMDEAWDFFSSPKNLAQITPPHMGFEITSPRLPKMYAGQLITYKIAVLPRFRVNWITEITHVETRRYFTDEQRKGPYKMWHHEHHFEEENGGVQMTDLVTFALPMGIFGRWAYVLFVKKQLKQIFDYRRQFLEQRFNAEGE